MKYEAAVAKLRLLSERLNYMFLVSLGLLISNIFLIWLVSWSFVHQKRTVVPAEIRQPFSISDTAVDASYLRQMALLFTAQRLNISPTNVAQNHGFILQYTDPKYYHDFVAVLNAEKQEVTKQNISSVFYPEEIIPDVNKMNILIKGTLARWVGSLGLPQVKKYYLITFSYNSGNLKVLSFAEKTEKAEKIGEIQ